MNGRRRGVLSLPAHLVTGDHTDDDELQGEVVKGAVREGVIGGEGEVGRVVVVPHRHIANIVTR